MSAFSRALSAEAYRLARNRPAVVWGFLFVPAASLTVGLLLDLMMLRAAPQWAAGPDPLWKAVRALGMAGNPIAHLFLAAGAAAIFGDEYRFAAWRILCPRLPRGAILAGKWTACLAAIAAALALLLLGSLALSWLVSLTTGVAPGTPRPSGEGLAIAWLGSFLELAAFASLAAAAIVLTRSALAAIVIAFLFSFGQTLVLAFLSAPAGLDPLLLMPAAAGDAARRFALLASGVAPVSALAALASLASLAAWSIGAILLAASVFARQDLSRE